MLIIGDSHVRSFSYSKHAYPVFLSSGKKLLLNNNLEWNSTLKKIDVFLSNEKKGLEKIYAVIGEPSIRFFIDDKNLNEQELTASVCDTYAKSLVERMQNLSDEIKNRYTAQLIFLPPVPRRDPRYAKVWQSVVRTQKTQDFELAGIFDEAVDDNGQITDHYFGDYIHANEKLADLLFKATNRDFVRSSSKYKWAYRYDFPRGETVWGEVGTEFLNYTGTASRDLKKACHKTQSLKRIVKCVNRIDLLFGRRWKVNTVLRTNGEGAWGFYSDEHSTLECPDPLRVARYEWLMRGNNTKHPIGAFKRLVFDFEALISHEELISRYGDFDEIIIIDDQPIKFELEGVDAVSFKIGSLHTKIYTQRSRFLIYYVLILICRRFV